MPTSFGNYTPREYQELERTNRELEAQVTTLQEAVGIRESTDRVATMARDALARATAKGGEIDRVAEATLADEVMDTIRDEKVRAIVEQLREERARQARAEVNDPDWVDRTREEYDQMFQKDGTYRTIDSTIQAAQREDVRASLLDNRRAAIAERIAQEDLDPEVQEQIEIDVARELEVYERNARAELPAAIKARSIEQGKAVIDEQISADLATHLKVATDKWVESEDGEKYRKKRTDEVKSQNTDKIKHAGRERIDGELLTNQQVFDKYLAEFSKDGVDLREISVGTPVVLVMGKVAEVKNPDYDSYSARYNGYSVPQTVLQLESMKRTMSLVAQGDGLFYVKQDSLSDDKNPFVANDSLAGKVISVGRYVENKSDKTTGIERKIAGGEVPFFDDDTTDDAVMDGRLPLVNIVIDGVSAIDEYKNLVK